MVETTVSGPEDVARVLKDFRCRYDAATGTLVCEWRSGFFSQASVTLDSLILLHRWVTRRPIRVEWRKSAWADPEDPDGDCFGRYFRGCQGDEDVVVPDGIRVGGCNGPIDGCKMDLLAPLVSRYFSPSRIVEEAREGMMRKYAIDPDGTAVLFYRGTDKVIEVPRVSPGVYLDCLRKVSGGFEPDGPRVMVQTDQKQARDFFEEEIGSRAFHVEEVPATALDKAVWSVRDWRERFAGVAMHELAVNYLAAVLIISKCRRIVMDVGNGPVWIGLFRGGVQGILQIRGRIELHDHTGLDQRSRT